MRQILQSSVVAASLLAVFSHPAAPARAGIAEWLAEVSAGTPAGYTNTGISGVEPISDDIGTYDDTTDGGVTYEFIVNAGDAGASSALMGSLGPEVGSSAAWKFEQYNDLGHYGITIFGEADLDTGIDTIFSQDSQVVFVNHGGTSTELFVNGSSATTLVEPSPTLSGPTGIGAALVHSSGAFIDPLDGELLGVAAYDSALSFEEVAAHYSAFLIPEPASCCLLAVCAGLFGLGRRAR